MRIDGYVRVSKVAGRSGESFQSPGEQRRQIEDWASRRGYEVAEVFEELDESGGRQDRPLLLRAIERAEEGQTDGVVVAKLDRFFRSQVFGLQAAQRLRDAGKFFASVDGVDTRDDRSALMLGIRLAIAEDERERRRQDFDAAVRDAVARGIHRCPVAPFGYRKRADRLLEPDPVSAPIVSEIFQRAANGESWAVIGRWVETRGSRTAYGAASWPARAIKDMVRNRVYLGEARNGEHVKPHAHLPLTDELTFRQAQRAGRASSPSRSEAPALLSGLIRCAGCRYGMQSYFARSGRQYRCRKKYAGGVCAGPAYVSADVIEPYVEQLLFDALGQVTPDMPSADMTALETIARDAEAALVTFRDNPVLLEQLGAEDFASGVRTRRQAFEDAQDRLIAARRELTPVVAQVEVATLWPHLTVDEKRAVLSDVFDAIFVLRGRSKHNPIAPFTRVFLRGGGPRDLPRRGVKRGQDLRPLGEDAAKAAFNVRPD